MATFTIIICTLGRVSEVDRLFTSLCDQNACDLEVILVDQNLDDRLEELVGRYKDRFRLIYLRSAKGLSIGRNLGIRHQLRSYVSFADDDCVYPADTIGHVKKFFEANPTVSILSGRSVDFDGGPSGPRMPKESRILNRHNVWRCGISYTLFFRKECIENTGEFDVNLGVGAPSIYQSGEETDYILRALKNRFRGFYDPTLTICHPSTKSLSGTSLLEKDWKYSLGMGRVLRKNGYNVFAVIRYIIPPILLALVYLLKGDRLRFRIYMNRAYGRLRGYRAAV